jgi:hypothetical protein
MAGTLSAINWNAVRIQLESLSAFTGIRSRPSVSICACSAGMRPGPLKAFGQVGNRIAPEGAPGIYGWRGFNEGARNPPDLSVAVTGHLRGSGGTVPCPTPVLGPDARAKGGIRWPV